MDHVGCGCVLKRFLFSALSVKRSDDGLMWRDLHSQHLTPGKMDPSEGK